MFETGPQTQTLSGLILSEFGGRSGVSVEEVFRWVVENTNSFLPTHVRIELEFLHQKGLISAIEDPADRPENAPKIPGRRDYS
jgi:Fe2+ or Zn2+ uptake regulation protein